MGGRRLVALLLLSAFCSCLASSNYSRSICLNVVQTWASQELKNISEDESGHLDDLIFFLHTPRTGGRILLFCLLYDLFGGTEERCNFSGWKCGNGEPCDWRPPHLLPKTLVPLQSSKHCKFLSSHDDYSVIEKLPRHQTSVVMMMRHPLARILGAYEFSVEVAARYLGTKKHPSFFLESSVLQTKTTITSVDVWPWNYIIPFMRDDILQRDRERRSSATSSSADNPYNASAFAMPLEDFISAPIAMHLLHNGATLQRRLDKMPVVGLTEKHKESAMLFTQIFGNQAFSEMQNDFEKISNGIPMKELQEHEFAHRNFTIASKAKIDKIIYNYESCSNTERKFYSSHRNQSLKDIAPLKFSKEAQKHISKDVLAEILRLNHLDVKLYEHAQGLFSMKQDLLNNQLKSKVTGLEEGHNNQGRGRRGRS